MKTIKEARKNIALLWRPPATLADTYRPMKFLLQTSVNEGLLLYNVVTSEMVLADDVEMDFFKGSSVKYCKDMDELIARHYLVPKSFNENKSVQQLRALLKKLEPPRNVHGFTILPTTECNARCFYCFESDHPRCTMTEQVAADTVAYIADKCKGEPVDITWFGGEPLVGAKRIAQICEGLRKKDIQYTSSVVSNAYLFDEKLIQEAKDDWHVKLVQITLDGTEKVYNETKAYIQPKYNPYQHVLQNIGKLLDYRIAVNIRLNVTSKNTADLSKLIDELDARFGGRKGFSGYAHAVYEDVGFDPLSYDNDMREWVDEQINVLEAKLREKKLLSSNMKMPGLNTIHCMSDNDSTRVIYPDGTIGKCENKSSLDGIGDIYRDISDKTSEAQYKETVDIPECNDCPLFPNCVTLKVCPETGKCSKLKLKWKIDQYTNLMKNQYHQFVLNISETYSEETSQPECDS